MTEYVIGGEPSRQGDIYSYGILVLEMFRGRRPIKEMFKDSFNLQKQIVDPALLATVEEKVPAAKGKEANHINGETEAAESPKQTMRTQVK